MFLSVDHVFEEALLQRADDGLGHWVGLFALSWDLDTVLGLALVWGHSAKVNFIRLEASLHLESVYIEQVVNFWRIGKNVKSTYSLGILNVSDDLGLNIYYCRPSVTWLVGGLDGPQMVFEFVELLLS